MYNLADVVWYLGVSRQTLLKWLKNGRFPDSKIKNGAWAISVADARKARRRRIIELKAKIDRLQGDLQRVTEWDIQND